MKLRLQNVQRACDLWNDFLQRLEQLELLEDAAERRQYHDLVDASSAPDTSSFSQQQQQFTSISVNRDVKIARFRAKQALEQQQQQLRAVGERRQRLGLQGSNTEMDGYDDESLQRELALSSLKLCKLQALEEWSSAVRELPMIQRMIQQQQLNPDALSSPSRITNKQRVNDPRAPQSPQGAASSPSQPFKLTQITVNGGTGQLQITNTTSAEVIRSQVFRAGWNQPTMSLEELAVREVEGAKRREESDKLAQEAQKDQPRRYEHLVRDGREDHADLVDASAALDRNWDDWKDENPKGSGNKRANVGDRNF